VRARSVGLNFLRKIAQDWLAAHGPVLPLRGIRLSVRRAF
jgi:hypothetical protein